LIEKKVNIKFELLELINLSV